MVEIIYLGEVLEKISVFYYHGPMATGWDVVDVEGVVRKEGGLQDSENTRSV